MVAAGVLMHGGGDFARPGGAATHASRGEPHLPEGGREGGGRGPLEGGQGGGALEGKGLGAGCLLRLCPLEPEVLHAVGSAGSHSMSINVATASAMGPLTHCHLDFASLSLTSVCTQAFLILLLVASALLFQISVHDFTCLRGMVTLGSAVSFR